ncbi:MAG TPA: ABC transporter permease [Candidatus Rikenella faecigallinarum]|uniref:ABC transporter permease n=1 Tax=Candidatus Rikenella faecigallinarum TaxID=2838745 RepID=A0A9D1QFX0_9BACT|nr:ABC transporter permease [Candidatus Rikenella faecigallinarum]
MGAFRTSLQREIRHFGQSRLLVTSAIILPVVMTVLYVLMFWKGTVHDLPIAVYDGDRTELSRQLVRMLDATPTAEVAFETESIGQGRDAMERGEVNALVVIPRGLQANILSGTGGAQISAEISGARILNSGLLKRDITTVFQAFNIGVETQMLGAKGIPAAKGYAMAYPVAMDKHILFNPYGSYAYYLLPGLLFVMLAITVSLVTVYTVGGELKNGTAAEWVETAGGSITRALAAKLTPYLLLFGVLSLFISTLLYRFMGLPFQGTHAAILVLGNLLFILAYMAIGVMLVAVTANMRFSLSMAGGLATASLSFCGLTFPAIAMYPAIAALAKLFPLTYFIDIFIEQSLRGAPLARSLGDIAALGAFTLAMAILMPRLKKVALEPKYYGKD